METTRITSYYRGLVVAQEDNNIVVAFVPPLTKRDCEYFTDEMLQQIVDTVDENNYITSLFEQDVDLLQNCFTQQFNAMRKLPKGGFQNLITRALMRLKGIHIY